jgi:hypothetical protein
MHQSFIKTLWILMSTAEAVHEMGEAHFLVESGQRRSSYFFHISPTDWGKKTTCEPGSEEVLDLI